MFLSESFWDSMENLVICCDWISLNKPIKKKVNPKSTWVFHVDISLRYIIRAGYDHCMYSSYQGLSKLERLCNRAMSLVCMICFR